MASSAVLDKFGQDQNLVNELFEEPDSQVEFLRPMLIEFGPKRMRRRNTNPLLFV